MITSYILTSMSRFLGALSHLNSYQVLQLSSTRCIIRCFSLFFQLCELRTGHRFIVLFFIQIPVSTYSAALLQLLERSFSLSYYYFYLLLLTCCCAVLCYIHTYCLCRVYAGGCCVLLLSSSVLGHQPACCCLLSSS